MKVEQAKQIASNAIEQLRQALEAGQSQRLKEYLAAIARFSRLFVAQRHAYRLTEAERYARRGLPR